MTITNFRTYRRKRNYNNRKKKYKESYFIEAIFLCVFLIVWGYNNNIVKKEYLLTIGLITLLIILFKVFTIISKNMRYNNLSQDQIDILSGKNFERYLRANFQKKGYMVKLTKDTGDYGADLILSKGNEKIAVQAKRYSGKVGVHAIQEVVGAMHYYKCNKAMVVSNSFYTNNAIKMAKECDVELWDRNTLKRMFKI